MLGFNPNKSLALVRGSFGYLEINNYNMSNVGCTGLENSIYDCPSTNYRLCYKYEAAGVICDYEPPNITIELVGGNNTKEGNVLLNGSPIW